MFRAQSQMVRNFSGVGFVRLSQVHLVYICNGLHMQWAERDVNYVV
jgi:hypothetical protein